MKTNFTIKGFRDLVFNEHHIDLHNKFDFKGFEYSETDMVLTMYWVKSSGNWARDEKYLQVKIVHSKVSFLQIYSLSDINNTQDDICLSEVTFYPNEDRITNDCFMDQETPGENDDIIYSFQNGKFIRVGCEFVNIFTAGA